jgi:hypothetical protein
MKIQREREEAERRARAAYKAKLAAENRKREEADARRREEIRKEKETQDKLKRLSPCPQGYNWHKTGGGWRCSRGGHFVSDAELQRSFMS